MRTELTPQVAAELLLDRYRVRRSLLEWCERCGFKPAEHQMLLVEKLEQVVQGKCKRLAVFMPPGSAKSTYGSVLFPPYVMACHPGQSIIAASHTVELAEKWGRRVRNLISEFGSLLNIKLAPDSQAAGRWSLSSGGEYYAAGVTTGIAGFRANGAIIDDPIRTREDANSKLIRDRVWEWFKSDLRTRLKPNGWIILIQTRWHEEDLAGHVLEEMAKGGEQWDVVSLPAQAEENDPLGREVGDWLWDTDYGYGDFLRGEKKTQTAINWSALFQQSPSPDEGSYFLRDWLRPYNEAPPREQMMVYGASDFAVTEDGGDYTVHGVVGMDPGERLYLLDLWRGQAASDTWIEHFCDLVEFWKPIGWAVETGQIRSALGPYMRKRMDERKTYVAMQMFPTRGDKAVRAQSIRGRAAIKGLYVPVHAPWYPAFENEMLAFPAGKHDDQVDALGLVGQVLDRMTAGRLPPEAKRRPVVAVGYGQSTATMEDLWSQRDLKTRRNAGGRIR